VATVSAPRPLTERDVAALQSIVGAELAVTIRPYVEYATVDSMRNFARAYGDDNPLFNDEDYGRSSRWGSIVAPPLFPIATGTATPLVDDAGPVMRAALRGAAIEVVDDRWMLHRWIQPGVRLERRDALVTVEPSTAGNSVTVRVGIRSMYFVGDETYAEHDREWVYGGRSIADADDDDRPGVVSYDDDALAEIEQAITGWSRRGAVPIDVRTIAPATRLGPMVKGPLTSTDLVAYRGGVGPGPFGVEPLGLAHDNRRVRPDFYDRDTVGAWDARERLHWDDEYARRCGHPAAYDYSHTRLNWMAHLVTDWMGDSARLESISFAHLAHNYRGDTHWIDGTVDRVVVGGDGLSRIVLQLQGVNQLGTVTCRGTATVVV
jgi:acyl dehydratase